MSVCPECGESVNTGWKVCPKCTTELSFPITEEEMRKKGDSSSLMQDSPVTGDALVGSTKIGSQTINDPDAIIEAYEKGKAAEKASSASESVVPWTTPLPKLFSDAPARFISSFSEEEEEISEEEEDIAEEVKDEVQKLCDGLFEEMGDNSEEREERFGQFIGSVPQRIEAIKEESMSGLERYWMAKKRSENNNYRFSMITFFVIPTFVIAYHFGFVTLPSWMPSWLSWMPSWPLYCCGVWALFAPLLVASDRTISGTFGLEIYDFPRKKTKPEFDPKWYSLGLEIPAYCEPSESWEEGGRDLLEAWKSTRGNILDFSVDEDALILQLVKKEIGLGANIQTQTIERIYKLSAEIFVKRLFVIAGDGGGRIVSSYFGRGIYSFDDELNFHG